ncbi:MAG: class I SAM-dependent methyltransferase [Gammaproteobacteria bacterium]|nr:class I SAM-dependent methyltransferase [Gammaproteobacteria bacterium]
MEHPRHSALKILHSYAQAPASVCAIETDDQGVDIRLADSRLAFHHSFVCGSLASRARQSSQAIIKACSNRQRSITSILDLTAGWGADSLTLASHGKQVTMLEQNELVYAIVAYSLERLAATSTGAILASQMRLENTNAIEYLRQQGTRREFDCIYLDPMFPAHKSAAKPGKEMQILQSLTTNIEMDDCFEQALCNAGKRVVVKRPAKAVSFGTSKPDLVYRERSIRFDIYLTA